MNLPFSPLDFGGFKKELICCDKESWVRDIEDGLPAYRGTNTLSNKFFRMLIKLTQLAGEGEEGIFQDVGGMDAAIEPTGTVFTAFLENPFLSLFTTTV
jgi:hypothetical protein